MYVWNSQCHGTTLTERGGSGDIYIYIYIYIYTYPQDQDPPQDPHVKQMLSVAL